MQGTNVCSLYVDLHLQAVMYDMILVSHPYHTVSYHIIQQQSPINQSINQPTNRTQAPINHSLSSVSLGIESDPLNHLQIFRHHLLDQILETGLGSPSKLLLGLGRIPQQQLDLGGTEIPLINLD